MRLRQQLDEIQLLLIAILDRETAREHYSTDEFARLVGRAEFTVREWCRMGRIKADKRLSGRGAHSTWAISHAELLRYQKQGLLAIG